MLTRRRFIGTTLVAGATLATDQARPQPASKRVIVDAQVHLWKANSPDWPWDPGVTPQLPEPFTIERALPMMDQAGVDRVVIVPPSLNDRNDYALEAVKRYPANAHGERGIAGVAFRVDRNGHVLSVRITQSYGFAALDQDALATLKRDDPLPVPPSGVSDEMLTIKTAIRYRLPKDR